MGNYVVKSGNLVKAEDIDIFCHQCNCFATMGAGIAKQIATDYPEVKAADKANFKEKGAYGQLGTILPVSCHDGRVCVNMYSQFHYGKGKQTDYEAFEKCLRKLAWFAKGQPGKKVGFPYGIGCGLAGGDWSIVEKMLQEFSQKIPNDVYIVRFADEG